MKNLLIIMMLTAIMGCKNSTDKVKLNQDTLKVAEEKPAQKQETIAEPKVVKKDTIRNEELTQMSEDFFQKAVINLSDSSFTVYQNIRADYRIFGYEEPDTNSRKILFFSVFTPDVEGNPYKCPFGSYYYSGAMENTQIKYTKTVGSFIKANLIKDKTTIISPVYFLKSWVEFDN